MTDYLTYLYLLTPLHTGGSSNEGNLMGIAREVHTEFPYLPASSLRGKIRSEIESKDDLKEIAGYFFGQKIKNGNQPTEGEVWFADATLLFFPIASLSHHLVWITCPLWLERWSRWLNQQERKKIQELVKECRDFLLDKEKPKSAVVSFSVDRLYLQTAVLQNSRQKTDMVLWKFQPVFEQLKEVVQNTGLLTQLEQRLIVLTEEDCISLVETGLQREVRVALNEDSKTVQGGSFRSEEAIPPEAILFFPWGIKAPKKFQPDSNEKDSEKVKKAQEEFQKKIGNNAKVGKALYEQVLKERLQFGGLEGLGRGWADLTTINIKQESKL